MHRITIPNSVHILDLPMVLVSPQHWSKQTSDGTGLMSGGKNTILTFQGYRKNIPYSMQYNTTRFWSTFGTICYQYFTEMVEHGSTTYKTLLISKHAVTDDEQSSSEGASELDTNKNNVYNADRYIPMYDWEGVKSSKQSPHGTHTHMCDQVHNHGHARLHPYAYNSQILTVEYPQYELLRWHYRLGHLSLNLIKAMVYIGLLPNKIYKAPIPKCAGCMFAAMTKNP